MKRIEKKRFIFFVVIISVLVFSLLVPLPSSFAYRYEDECECFSDFGCGIGYRCVKPPFSSCGVCMREVDRYGLPTYRTPDPRSIEIRTKGDCDFDTDCPVGFYCHPKYKVCVKKR
ncbi:MAG: hypothetical protein ACO2PO_09935 [Candidatus Calescibacterium sp.]|jgi:hypothetical protein